MSSSSGGAAGPSHPYASWSHVEAFLASQRATTLRLNGSRTPRVDYVVWETGDIALHLQLGPRQRVPRSPLPLVRIEEIAQDGIRMARLRLTQRHLQRDFHDLLNAVADRVVAHDRTPDQAFNETVRAWSALLESPRALHADKRIGLLGELVVMNSLASTHGWEVAATAWRGTDHEEHDFGLPGFDIEVKSTVSERRTHVVHGLDQLTPTPGRPLWLTSVQFTRGGAAGHTLSEAVRAVRTRIADAAPSALGLFEHRITAFGWSPAALDDERWALRSAPLVLTSDSHLPRLDRSLLDSLPPEVRGLVAIDSYRIDVTDLPPADDPPEALQAFRIP
ncbi:PD-(D/E)XK motif protein [Streptomyces sp. NBC_00083]|uniref:PD-(D/E)XK motif protein n=1 Tax=Streptomyces sp. NBC_00083 TaxID=2975647 RepID=UPI00224D1398|nr:PD-(D/E)XK motif protein [Streptomyces sp. NBC_00083]MCX5382226.1 PD-(D/E)XK motif protein [Streptomyces sp. NBC_00083]